MKASIQSIDIARTNIRIWSEMQMWNAMAMVAASMRAKVNTKMYARTP